MRGGRRPVTAASADLDLCAERARCASVSAALAECRVCDPTEITESTQLPCPLVCGRAAAGDFHKCEVRLVFGPPPPVFRGGVFWQIWPGCFQYGLRPNFGISRGPQAFESRPEPDLRACFVVASCIQPLIHRQYHQLHTFGARTDRA